MKVALAIGAHPDDIEFMMCGTLLLLKRAGYDIHYLNLSSGNLGSTEHSSEDAAAVRLQEAHQQTYSEPTFMHLFVTIWKFFMIQLQFVDLPRLSEL
jgi:hypothetical protein